MCLIIGASDGEILKYLKTSNLRPNEPDRVESIFKRFCPVSFYTKHEFVTSPPDFVVVFKGQLYFLASFDYQLMFLEYPERYLTGPFNIHNLKIAIVGLPLCDHEALVKSICAKYSLDYINVEQELMRREIKGTSSETDDLSLSMENVSLSLI